MWLAERRPSHITLFIFLSRICVEFNTRHITFLFGHTRVHPEGESETDGITIPPVHIIIDRSSHICYTYLVCIYFVYAEVVSGVVG
jgi:hypothetical protein